MSGAGQPPPNLAAAIQALVQQQQARQLADDVRHQREEMIAMQGATFDKAMAYTNLITLGGYAGAFAIWSYTRDQLSSDAIILVAILLGISLAAFILFEVFQMIHRTRVALKQRALIIAPLTPAEFLRRLDVLRQEINEDGLKWIMPIWVVQLVIAIGAALLAIGLLFFNFFAVLIGFSQWPS